MTPIELISIAIAGCLGLFAVTKFVFHLNGKAHQRINDAKDDYRQKLSELNQNFNNERVATAEKYVKHDEFRDLKRTFDGMNIKVDGMISDLSEIKGALKK